MTRIKEIIKHLELVAPLSYQESYDNSGLLVGNEENEVTAVLITLDVTEEVIEEAISLGCNLIIAHHPIIFKGLKTLTGKNYVERTVLKAIKNDIALYAIHTNLDNVKNGVNKKICEKIGLKNIEVLVPKTDTLSKLVTFVPEDYADKVKEALFSAGAGQIGNYNDCNFSIKGIGEFTPSDKANPAIGTKGHKEKVNEVRIEVVVPSFKVNNIISELKKNHPYEEVAYYLNPLSNSNQEVGSGMIGYLENSMNPVDFLKHLKSTMNLNVIRHTSLGTDNIQKIAVCGGSGSFLLSKAIQQKADVYISADFKYHEFFDADKKIIIADIGHYESEIYTKDLIFDIISEKFFKFALNLSKTVTNPISYL
jgi:dinuclear metal center YbgI/SA1388 family protein